jgi:PPOX class probable F420-dependent enzyme
VLTANPRVADALDAASIGFLTAVNLSGQPQTSPVWFLRDGDDLIVYSRPGTPRIASIAANPKVDLTLRGDRHGNGRLTVEGHAAVDPTLAPAHEFPGYLEKYGERLTENDWAPEGFAADYSVGIRIEPTRVISWGLSAVIAAEQ